MRRNGSKGAAVVAIAVVGLALLVESPSKVNAQGAIGFQPGITPVPDGVYLGVTPVVSADRRYVRLGVTPQFTTLRGVDTFSFPGGIVSGGGFGGGFGGGGFGGGGGNFGGGGNGPGGGFAAVAPNPNPAIIPNRQLNQIAAAGNNGNNNGTAVIPGLAAVSSGWASPYYGGFPTTYGYGYTPPNYAYGSNPYGNGFGYNPYGNGFYNNGYNGYFQTPIYQFPGTVNGMGDVMGAIIQSVGGRR